MKCKKCDQALYYTGECNPTSTPQRFYACENRHVYLRYDAHEPVWGDRTVTERWHAEVILGNNRDAYEFLGRVK